MNRLWAALRRRPTRAYLYSLMTPGFAVAQGYGWTTGNQAALWISFGGVLLAVTGAELAQRKTTPLADPRTTDGRPAEVLPEPQTGDTRWMP